MSHGSQRIWKRFFRHRMAGVAGLFLIVLSLGALFAPYVAPYNPLETHLEERLLGPSWHHPFGTDDLGRDIFSRILYGGRVSLSVAAVAVSIAMTVGTFLGVTAAYAGGSLDAIIMRFTDIILAFPGVLLAIGIMAVLGPSTLNVMLAVGIIYIPIFARTVRSRVLMIRDLDFVKAAKAAGMGGGAIVWRHIVPNTLDIVIVQASLAAAFAILAEAALSFLGLGTQPPYPTWGSMLFFARSYMLEAPWWAIFPGMAIFSTVLSLNILGDGLRDALDPKA